jgi:hypothetical protein
MPCLFAHYLTAQAAMRRSPREIVAAALASDLAAYRLGAQGPDILFYYKALPWQQSDEAIRVGFKMHEHDTAATFACGLEYVRDGSSPDRSAALAYLCGLSTHLCLDAEAHPWILYWTGDITEGAPQADRMRALHRHNVLETAIDAILVSDAAGAAGTDWLRRQRLMAVSRTQATAVGRLYEHVLREVHGERFTAEQVREATRDMTRVFDLLTDRRRLRTRAMGLVAAPFDRDRFIRDSVYPTVPDPVSADLFAHAHEWRLPMDQAVVRSESFGDLFDRAAERSAKCVVAIARAGLGQIPIDEAVAVVGDRSMLTGAECEDARPLVAFAPGRDELWGSVGL